MKIAIAGSGAMGSRFGYMLHQSGNDVLLVDKWDEHIHEINCHGLTVINEEGRKISKVKATRPEETTKKVELLIVFTKAMDTDSMLSSCKKIIGEKTRVLTLQNGLGNIETLEKYVTQDRVLAGVTTFGTELIGPGKIQALGSGAVQITQADGKITEEVQQIAAIMNDAEMNAEVSANALTSIWNKVAFNCVLNTVCTLMNDTVSAVGNYSQVNEVIEAIIEEIILVAEKEEIRLNKEEITNMITEVFDPRMSGNHLPSMVQDMENGRKTEIDYLNGAIVSKGEQHDIPVPINRMITHFIKMMEEIRDKKRIENV